MSTLNEITELLVAIAAGVFVALFLTAFFILIVACNKKRYYNKEKRDSQINTHFDDRLTLSEINYAQENKQCMNVETICLNEAFEKILTDNKFMDDISGLIPHCLAILKHCRSLTERLTALTMGAMNNTSLGLKQIVDCAKKISNRVDDLVGSMYPPLNPQLLEARAASLILAVSHLAILAQFECTNKKIPMDWIDKGLRELEEHIKFLKSASRSISNQSSSRVMATTNYESRTNVF